MGYHSRKSSKQFKKYNQNIWIACTIARRSGALTRQFRNATPSSLGEIMREVHGQFMLAYIEVQGVHGQFSCLDRSLVDAKIFKLHL
jgi:hypothetical protein